MASPAPDTPIAGRQKFERMPILRKHNLEATAGVTMLTGADPVHVCLIPHTMTEKQAESDLQALRANLDNKVLVSKPIIITPFSYINIMCCILDLRKPQVECYHQGYDKAIKTKKLAVTFEKVVLRQLTERDISSKRIV